MVMKKDLSERIKACIAIESGVADIYHSFAKLFLEAKAFWYELAKEEENHANVLQVGSRYVERGQLPGYVVPRSLKKMKGTLQLIDDIKERVKSRNISMKEALDMAIKLELTMEESYLLEVLTMETDNEVIISLQKLVGEIESHINRINEYMQQEGYK